MKSRNTSFLVFFVLFCVAQRGNSQKATDSTGYYVTKIIDSKKSTDLVDAISYLEKSKSLNKAEKNDIAVVYNLIYIAQAQQKIGELYDGDAAATEALQILDAIDRDAAYDNYRLSLYNVLGNIQNELKNYDVALQHYEAALLLNEEPRDRITLINNIGTIYDKKEDFKSAIVQFTSAYKESLKFNEPAMTARALDNLGAVQSKINNDNGLKNMLAALDIRLELNHLPGMLTSYLHLATYYKDKGDVLTAQNYANKAVALADSTKNPDFEINALTAYASLNDDLKITRLMNLRDSLDVTNLQVQSKYASQKYDSEKNEKAATAAMQNAEKRTYQMIIAVALTVLILLATFFSYFYLKSKHKKEKLQEVYNTETRISRKIHDELANDVYQVMTKLQVAPKDKSLIDDLEHIYNRTRDISQETSSIDSMANFQQTLNDLFISYKSEEVNVITKNSQTLQWDHLNTIKKQTVYRVLHELLINMKKHSEASVVVFSFEQLQKQITISYTDNGKGCQLIKGNGLQNTENRIASINGTIIFESEVHKGFHATITV
ncbi:MAG: hypothetical protein NWQ19_08995 [Nonlabens sp.]|nr:hypothetical protein [Nonlabens sp.]